MIVRYNEVMSGKKDAVNAVGEVARTHQYTLLQDAYHADDANYDFALSKAVLNELEGQGVKHYVLEMDQRDQGNIDQLISGEISRKEFIDLRRDTFIYGTDSEKTRIASDLADMIVTAQDLGIEVHALDRVEGRFTNTHANITLLREMGMPADVPIGELIDKLEASKENSPTRDEREFIDETLLGLNALKVDRSEGVFSALNDALFKERNDGDKALAERIKAATGDEKTAILFGVGHGMVKDGVNGKDLDEHLGNDKVGKVLLTPSNDTYEHYMINIMEGQVKEQPATIIYTDAKDDFFGRHEVQPWQAQAAAIGAELKGAELRDAQYSQLDLPSSAELANAPKAIQVHGDEISR